jgi:hypothetical protein
MASQRLVHIQEHGVDPPIFVPPYPPSGALTLPTIAWPPSATWTCWTVIFCSPFERYSFSADFCAAKVPVSLLKALEALSCCGIVSTCAGRTPAAPVRSCSRWTASWGRSMEPPHQIGRAAKVKTAVLASRRSAWGLPREAVEPCSYARRIEG